MDDVIDLAERRARREKLATARAEATALLEEIGERLFTAAFNLAAADAWREWDEATPEGTVVEIDPEALLECSDPHVRALARLWVDAQETLERLGEPASAVTPPRAGPSSRLRGTRGPTADAERED